MSEGRRRRIAVLTLVAATLCLAPARGSAAAPPALAGVDLAPESGAAAYRGGIAVVHVGERIAAALVVLDPEGRAVCRLEPRVAGPDATAWVWDGREARGAATGVRTVRLETAQGTRTATLARPVRARGEVPRVTFTIRADPGR